MSGMLRHASALVTATVAPALRLAELELGVIYIDVSDDAKPIRKRVPVTLILEHQPYETKPWAGLEITKWLDAHKGAIP